MEIKVNFFQPVNFLDKQISFSYSELTQNQGIHQPQKRKIITGP